MQQQNAINPDVICQQALQAKMNVYQAKEHFETVLKVYNDHVDALINVMGIMKNRILELEQNNGEQKGEEPAGSGKKTK